MAIKAFAAAAGITAGPGIEDPFAGWRQYNQGGETGIYMDVLTGLAFEPVYVASLIGNSTHWRKLHIQDAEPAAARRFPRLRQVLRRQPDQPAVRRRQRLARELDRDADG